MRRRLVNLLRYIIRRWLGVPTVDEFNRLRGQVHELRTEVLLRARARDLEVAASAGDRQAPVLLQVITGDHDELLQRFGEGM